MHDTSPPESVHALDIDGLRHPAITFWSAWVDGELAGIGALKRLDAARGELKSMRVDDRFRGSGVGRAILRHIVHDARERGMTSLWLETGLDRGLPPGASASTRARDSSGATRSRVRARSVLGLPDPRALTASDRQRRARRRMRRRPRRGR